jgi:hypothetical protein
MEVKGIALKTTRDFVKTNFPGEYRQWLDKLPPTTKETYDLVIDVSKWYPIQENYIIPLNVIADLFYRGDGKECGEALGYYSADVALKGIYKVFLIIASPNFLMQRAGKIITTYYQPSQVEAVKISDKSAAIRILEFSAMNHAMEYRFAGWCKRALELSNCNHVKYHIDQSLVNGDPCTELVFSWY